MKHSFLDRMALAAFTTPVMWGFFAFINVFLIAYVEWQEYSYHPFDKYPFVFLNLILAIFVAEMDVVIVIAQIVGSSKADEQTAKTAELVAKTDDQTTMLVGMMESNLTLMRSLADMGHWELERDAQLHQIIKEGHARGMVIERLIREMVEDRS